MKSVDVEVLSCDLSEEEEEKVKGKKVASKSNKGKSKKSSKEKIVIAAKEPEDSILEGEQTPRKSSSGKRIIVKPEPESSLETSESMEEEKPLLLKKSWGNKKKCQGKSSGEESVEEEPKSKGKDKEAKQVVEEVSSEDSLKVKTVVKKSKKEGQTPSKPLEKKEYLKIWSEPPEEETNTEEDSDTKESEEAETNHREKSEAKVKVVVVAEVLQEEAGIEEGSELDQDKGGAKPNTQEGTSSDKTGETDSENSKQSREIDTDKPNCKKVIGNLLKTLSGGGPPSTAKEGKALDRQNVLQNPKPITEERRESREEARQSIREIVHMFAGLNSNSRATMNVVAKQLETYANVTMLILLKHAAQMES
ncbi:unnamed protein product [Calypogeia fissa]